MSVKCTHLRLYQIISSSDTEWSSPSGEFKTLSNGTYLISISLYITKTSKGVRATFYVNNKYRNCFAYDTILTYTRVEELVENDIL